MAIGIDFQAPVTLSGGLSGASITEANLSLADNTTANVATTRHGLAPKLPNDATKFLNGVGAYAVPPGTSAVSSVFGRTGAVVAATNDYSEAQLSFTDITTNNVSTSKHGFTPKLPNDATKYLDGTGAYSVPPGSSAVSSVFGRTGAVVAATNDYSEAQLSFTDITTNNVSTSKHGFAPKLPNDATKYLDGTGAYSVPAGGGSGPGTQLDYVERTTDLTVTATSDATAAAFITGNAVSYDGTTRVKIEVWVVAADITPAQAAVLNLYDGSTDLGRVALANNPLASGNNINPAPLYGVRFLTPSNASHTYTIKAWKTGGTVALIARAGGVATYMPAWYRITTT